MEEERDVLDAEEDAGQEAEAEEEEEEEEGICGALLLRLLLLNKGLVGLGEGAVKACVLKAMPATRRTVVVDFMAFLVALSCRGDVWSEARG